MTLVYALITTRSGFETALSGLETFTREREFKDLIYEVMNQGSFYNQIVDNLVQSNDIILDAKADNILVSDKIFLFLDPEIAHGATLQIEYVITVSALNGLENYTIEENLTNSNLKFRADNNLLTENKTNGQVGWKYVNGKLIKTGRGGTTEKVKIVLSTVISAEDFRYTYKNKAICGIKSVGLGESVATGYSRVVESPEVSIIPPFGDGNTYEAKIKQYAPMVITLIVTTGVVIFLITKKKK